MDRRFILQGLECQASIGIYDAERANTQRIKIDAEVRLYPATEPVDDKVDSTLNYDLIRETTAKFILMVHYVGVGNVGVLKPILQITHWHEKHRQRS